MTRKSLPKGFRIRDRMPLKPIWKKGLYLLIEWLVEHLRPSSTELDGGSIIRCPGAVLEAAGGQTPYFFSLWFMYVCISANDEIPLKLNSRQTGRHVLVSVAVCLEEHALPSVFSLWQVKREL